jgi:hypothetical protein
MARVAMISIFAVRALIINLIPCIVASSALIRHSIAMSVLLPNIRHCRYIVWRCVDLVNKCPFYQ